MNIVHIISSIITLVLIQFASAQETEYNSVMSKKDNLNQL